MMWDRRALEKEEVVAWKLHFSLTLKKKLLAFACLGSGREGYVVWRNIVRSSVVVCCVSFRQ